jgi:hypothetical protein
MKNLKHNKGRLQALSTMLSELREILYIEQTGCLLDGRLQLEKIGHHHRESQESIILTTFIVLVLLCEKKVFLNFMVSKNLVAQNLYSDVQTVQLLRIIKKRFKHLVVVTVTSQVHQVALALIQVAVVQMTQV